MYGILTCGIYLVENELLSSRDLLVVSEELMTKEIVLSSGVVTLRLQLERAELCGSRGI